MPATELLAWMVAVGILVAVIAGTAVLIRGALAKNLVISPFLVTGRDDPDGKLARSLALLLHDRLLQVQEDLATAQRDLVHHGPEPAALDVRALLVPRFIVEPVSMATMVLSESPGIDVKVAGIEFGGVAAWLSRLAARRRTLVFTVDFGEDRALVTGSLPAAEGQAAGRLWFQTGTDPGEVTTTLAHAVLQARMAAGPDGARVRALRLADFRVLVGELCTLARLNGRIIAGQAAGTEDFHEVLQRLSPVADSVPDWPELGFLVAQVAERAGESARALQLYEKLLRLDDTTPLEPGLHRAADDRITALRVAVAPARSAREAAFVDAVRAYEERLGLGPPHPDVVFMEDPTKWQGAQAVWNEERRRYEVSPNAAADPAVQLEKYVALMGRFMAQHYGRCLPGLSADLWNQFRLSVVEFLIASEPGTAYQPAIHFPLLESLRLMSDDAGAEPVRRLALRLLDRFDCDWTAENLVEKLVPIAADVGVPEQVVRSRLERPAGDDEVAG